LFLSNFIDITVLPLLFISNHIGLTSLAITWNNVTNNPDTTNIMTIIVVWSIFIITALTIIKGWLLEKEISPGLLGCYDKIYQALTVLISAEVIALLLWLIVH
jgi:hypothetical protein